MQKPADLREYLIAQFPQLGKKPDNLQMFIESGAVRARINNRNFQINYQLQVIFLLDQPQCHRDDRAERLDQPQ